MDNYIIIDRRDFHTLQDEGTIRMWLAKMRVQPVPNDRLKYYWQGAAVKALRNSAPSWNRRELEALAKELDQKSKEAK